MANQIIVTQSGNVQVSIEPTPNVQVQISRAAIGTVSNVPTANFANYAANVTSSSQPNITSLGTLVNLTSAGNITAPFFIGNIIGNVSGNIVVPGTNTSVLYNNAGIAGASDAFQFNQASNTVTITGNLSATNISANGAGLSSITGANVTGQVGYAGVANSVSGSNVSGAVSYATTANAVAGANVSGQVAYAAVANSVAGSNVSGAVAYATTANSVAGANVSGQVSYAAVANSVSVGNVSGIGNISTINIDGNLGNVLYGNGVFAAVIAPTSVANANYANFAGTAFSVSGSNVSGAVANATYANNAGNATIANSANSVAVANVSGIGNIATVNLDGNASNILYGNGVFATTPIISNVANANYANFAGTAYSVSGANVSGEVANANYASFANVASIANSVAGANVSGEVANANYASFANIAASANSVAVANVSGIGNIAVLNLDGSSSNVLFGNGVFAPESTSIANANYANFAGQVVDATQSNITQVGTLVSLAVTGNVSANAYQLTTTPGTLSPATGQMVWDTASNTVSLGMLNGVTQQIGLESYVLVKASATITDGQVVMFTGANGNHVQAAPADTTSVGFRPEYIIGVATQSIATNDFGYITVFGIVHGLNTNAFNVGDILWVDNTTPGALTATRPSDPNFQIEVAAVTKKSSGDGHLQVRVTAFNSINELTDVTITTPTAGQALVYNASNLWVNGVPAYANTANSVAVANVSGIGNIATINLTGSSSNVLYGNGVFAPESQTGNANFASYAGNVTVNAQSNITSLGNLVSLTVRDSNTSNPITQFIPTGNTIGTATFGNTMLRIDNFTDLGNANGVQNISFVKSRGNSTTPAATANNDVAMRVASYVYNGNAYPKVGQMQFIAAQAANANLQLANTAWTAGQFQVQVGNPYGSVANANANTNFNTLTYNQNGTLVLFNGTNTGGVAAPAINVISYGIAANGVGVTTPWFSQRARGNRDSNVAVATGDNLGIIGWQGYNGNAFFSTRYASINANVNTSHGTIANGASIPTDLSFVTCSNTTAYTTILYGNGSANFPGLVSATGNVTGGNLTTGGAVAATGNISGNNISLTNGITAGNSISITLDNISTANPSFAFSTYNNANALVNPYTFYRARGNVASPAAAQVNDAVSSIGYNIYADSGNTYLSVATSSVNVLTNDGAGNVSGDYSITASKISLLGNVYPTNVVFTKFNETVSSPGSVSGTITPDLANGSIFKYTLTGNITLNSLANVATGSSATIVLTQDGTGGRTLTSSMLFAGGAKTLSTAVGAVDIISVFYDGSVYYATLSKGYA